MLNTVDGLDVKTEMLPFKGDNEVEQFSTSIIRGDKFAPALDGVVWIIFNSHFNLLKSNLYI